MLAIRTGEGSIPRADFLRHQKRVYARLQIAFISNSSFSDQGTKPELYLNTDTMLFLKAYSFMEGVRTRSDSRESIRRFISAENQYAGSPQQPSFAAAVSSPSAPPRGAYGLLVFVLRLITSEANLTVSSLRNPNYAGAVNNLRTIIENGKIIQKLPEVPEERYDELLRAAIWSN